MHSTLKLYLVKLRTGEQLTANEIFIKQTLLESSCRNNPK